MTLLLILLLAVDVGSTRNDVDSMENDDGRDASESCKNVTTFVAMVRDFYRGIYCHAVLVDARWAITMPECVRPNMHLTVMPEDPYHLKTRWAWKYYTHPIVNLTTSHNDVTVLRMYGKFARNGWLEYARLANDSGKDCSKLVLVDYSFDTNGRPLWRHCQSLRLVRGAECDAALERQLIEHGICARHANEKAANTDLCEISNNGSPLICVDTGEVIALTPFTDRCDPYDETRGYIRVDRYMDFIRKSMAGGCAGGRTPAGVVVRWVLVVFVVKAF